jgi:xanthine dehydrogenase small subunit
MALNFILNGQRRAEDVRATMTVLEWLRSNARLTGTKEGCAEGDCGACTILVARPSDNGPPRWQAANACLMVMGQLDGCAVMTIEGVAADGRLSGAQQALLEAEATQCGYCTPGVVLAMTALQQDGARPSTDAIHTALSGNLCRCTGYRAIIDACRDLPASPPSAPVGLPAPAAEHRAAGETFMAPATLADLLALRARHPDAVLLAGGTDLGLDITKRDARWPLTIFTGGVAALRTVEERADVVVIGGAATFSDALPALARRIPAFAALVRRIGSPQIRNLGTFAGNMVTASPVADTPPCLIALGARVHLASVRGSRTVMADGFVTGYHATALAADEIVERIEVPVPLATARVAAYKLSKRFDQDIATVVAAFHLDDAGSTPRLRAAFGGIGERAARAGALERAWESGRLFAMPSTAVEALLVEDFPLLGDDQGAELVRRRTRGSRLYRRHAAAGLVRRFILEAEGASAPLSLEAL